MEYFSSSFCRLWWFFLTILLEHLCIFHCWGIMMLYLKLLPYTEMHCFSSSLLLHAYMTVYAWCFGHVILQLLVWYIKVYISWAITSVYSYCIYFLVHRIYIFSIINCLSYVVYIVNIYIWNYSMCWSPDEEFPCSKCQGEVVIQQILLGAFILVCGLYVLTTINILASTCSSDLRCTSVTHPPLSPLMCTAPHVQARVRAGSNDERCEIYRCSSLFICSFVIFEA